MSFRPACGPRNTFAVKLPTKWDRYQAVLRAPSRWHTPIERWARKLRLEKILRDLQPKLEGTSVPPHTMATIYAGLGDKKKSLQFLEKPCQARALGTIVVAPSGFPD
jgi:hypothetical protein